MNCSCKMLSLIEQGENTDLFTGRRKSDDTKSNREINYKMYAHQEKNIEKVELLKSEQMFWFLFHLKSSSFMKME